MELVLTQEDTTIPSNHGGDFYAVLGVHRKAKKADIVLAYRRLMMRFHPDRWKPKEGQSEEAREAFLSLVQRAFDTLSDSKKRKFYDETGCTHHTEVELQKLAAFAVDERITQVCLELCKDSNPISIQSLERMDLMSHVRDTFRREIDQNIAAQKNIGRVISKLSVVIKRLSRKKQPKLMDTPIGAELNRQLMEARKATAQSVNRQKVLEVAIVMLKDYNYKREVPEPVKTMSHYGTNLAPQRFHLD